MQVCMVVLVIITSYKISSAETAERNSLPLVTNLNRI